MPERKKTPNLTPALFIEEYEEATERAREALREYLGDPGEEKTRRVRASVRRLETCVSLLPKKGRTKSLKRQRERAQKLLGFTSMVRDLDIIAQKLEVRAPAEPGMRLMLENVREERADRAGDSMKSAWKLFEHRALKLSKKEAGGVSQRARSRIRALGDEIAGELSLVLKNEGRVDELHSLRQHAKKLRYTLELMPRTAESTKTAQTMREWQDVLGEIRDSDVLIDYLGRARSSAPVRRAIEEERESRHRRYRAFVDACEKTAWRTPTRRRRYPLSPPSAGSASLAKSAT